MARSSSKIQFDLKTLKAKAMESIDLRIEQKRKELAELADDTVLQERIAEWRTSQEARVSQLFRELGEGGVGDHQLATFKIDPIPSSDMYTRTKAERELRQLEAERSRTEAKSGSLVADEDGNISLTSTQMSEFFGL